MRLCRIITFYCALSPIFLSPASAMLAHSNAGMSSRARMAATAHTLAHTHAPGVDKIIILLQEMLEVAEEDLKKDKKEYDKYMCWALAAVKAKEAAVAAGKESLRMIRETLDEAIGRILEMNGQLEDLEKEIEGYKTKSATAKSQREEQAAAYEAEKADLEETIHLLGEAIEVLSKELLLQKSGHGEASSASLLQAISPQVMASPTSLLQINEQVDKNRSPKFRSIMQTDFMRMLGSLVRASKQQEKEIATNSPAGKVFLKKGLTLNQAQADTLPPELQGGGGAMPEVKSYNRRSDTVIAMMETMKAQRERDLLKATDDEMAAIAAYNTLYGLTMDALTVCFEQKDVKKMNLVEVVKYKAEWEVTDKKTKKIVDEDTRMLSDLEFNKEAERRAFEERTAVRQEEMTALTMALTTLTDDAARDNFMKTGYYNFMQVSSSSSQTQEWRRHRFRHAMQRIMKAAHSSGDATLAQIAVTAKSDAFGDVIMLMKSRKVQLQHLQETEYTQFYLCKKKIKKGEDEKLVLTNKREDLSVRAQGLEDGIKLDEAEKEKLLAGIDQIQKEMQTANKIRNEETDIYKVASEDQKKTIELLKEAKARLAEFYESEAAEDQAASLIQVATVSNASFLQVQSESEPQVVGLTTAAPMVGRCASTPNGCCADGRTEKINPQGTNCAEYEGDGPGAKCADSKFGCCDDGFTSKHDLAGSNCEAPEIGTVRTPDARKTKAVGIIAMMSDIIKDAETELLDIELDERNKVDAYAEFMQIAEASKKAKNDRLTEVNGALATTRASLASTEQELGTNQDYIDQKDAELDAYHGECDFLILNYQLRQDARTDEIEAIDQAEAILSGAKID